MVDFDVTELLVWLKVNWVFSKLYLFFVELVRGDGPSNCNLQNNAAQIKDLWGEGRKHQTASKLHSFTEEPVAHWNSLVGPLSGFKRTKLPPKCPPSGWQVGLSDHRQDKSPVCLGSGCSPSLLSLPPDVYFVLLTNLCFYTELFTLCFCLLSANRRLCSVCQEF